MAVSTHTLAERKVGNIMNLTKSDADDLLSELVSLSSPVREEGDVDVLQYWNSLPGHDKISIRAARDRLDKLVEQGILIKIKGVYDPDSRRSINVYRKAV